MVRERGGGSREFLSTVHLDDNDEGVVAVFLKAEMASGRLEPVNP